MAGAFWDRVTGEQVRRLPSRPLLGRYQIAAPGMVNGREAAARTPIVPAASGHWSASVAGHSEAGHFGRGALPAQELARRTAAIAAALTEAAAAQGAAHEGKSPYERWVAVPPLATDLIAQLHGARDDEAVRGLERAIDAYLPHLEQVCRRPETRLRREAEVMPVSRSRRLAPDALAYLAAHTEDWHKRTIWGVYPQRVRAVRNEAHPDLYENQLSVQLIDNLLDFLEWRRQQLRTLTDFFAGLETLSAALKEGAWRSQRRLSFLLGEFFDYAELQLGAIHLHEQTVSRWGLVANLRASPLYRDRRVDRHAELPAELRNTNLLTHHEHYQRVGELWRAWACASRAMGLGNIIGPHRYCESFSSFVALLIARSLETLGYRAAGAHAPAPGLPDLEYTGPSGSLVTLHCAPDGTLQLRRDATPLVIFTPLPHPLTAEPQATDLRALAAELGRQRNGQPPRVIVYPGSQGEREKLPPLLHRRADTLGNDLTGGPATGLLPVTPADLASVERMTRAVQWALVAPDALLYPPRVRCPPELAGDLLPAYGSWLAAEGGEVAVGRPPDSQEWDDFQELVRRWRAERLPPARRREREAAADAFAGEMAAARAMVRRLACCPVCKTEARPRRDFQARKGTFRVTCQGCKNEWGTQSCSSCGASYPVIHMRQQPRRDDGHQTAAVLGNETLALACLRTGVTAYICSRCGRCGGHDAPAGQECRRCRELT